MRTVLFRTLKQRCRKQPSGDALLKKISFRHILDFDNELMEDTKIFYNNKKEHSF